MPIDIRAWLDQAQASLQAAFGPRLLFLGLQGSYGRGEAQEGSDIDLVVILDEAAPEDWRIYRGLLSALLFSAVFRLLADPVLHLCGATEATYAAAYGYAKWVVILGGPFTILNTLLANLVRAEGGAGAAAFGVSFGGVLNILLDPLFVLPQFLGLGAVRAKRA